MLTVFKIFDLTHSKPFVILKIYKTKSWFSVILGIGFINSAHTKSPLNILSTSKKILFFVFVNTQNGKQSDPGLMYV